MRLNLEREIAVAVLYPLADLAGRILMSVIYLASGIGGMTAYEGTANFMEAHGLPGFLLAPSIAVEILGGLMLIAGYGVRLVALMLGGFTLTAAVVFHTEFGDLNERIMFLKNLAMAGGMGVLFANGAGPWSIDARRQK